MSWALSQLERKKNLPHLLNFAIIFRQFKCGDGEGETVKNWLLKIPILDYRSLVTDGERKSKYFFIYSWFRIQKCKRKKKFFQQCFKICNFDLWRFIYILNAHTLSFFIIIQRWKYSQFVQNKYIQNINMLSGCTEGNFLFIFV